MFHLRLLFRIFPLKKNTIRYLGINIEFRLCTHTDAQILTHIKSLKQTKIRPEITNMYLQSPSRTQAQIK